MEKHLESTLDEASVLFKQFDENTENGNYLKAREIVFTIEILLEKTKKNMELIPTLLNECQTAIPNSLNELNFGYKEMVSQGYMLDHISLESESERISQEVKECLGQFEELDMEEVQKKVDSWKEYIDNLFDLLEKEVLAKHEIKKQDREILDMLESARKVNQDLSTEFIQIQSSYHLQDSYLDVIDKLAKRLTQLNSRFELIESKVHENQAAYSHLKDELMTIKDMVNDIVQEQEEFGAKLQALRKDEFDAREKVAQLKLKVAETIRVISKSNIPGVSDEYKDLLEDARDSIMQVIGKLNETPLDIPTVQEYLEVAALTVEKMTNQTIELFETVRLAEKMIQYGNRYRSKYPHVDQGLKEAEQAFRSYRFKEALEIATAAIEKHDPDALRKVENQVEDLIEV